jgi:hypothetical protein
LILSTCSPNAVDYRDLLRATIHETILDIGIILLIHQMVIITDHHQTIIPLMAIIPCHPLQYHMIHIDHLHPPTITLGLLNPTIPLLIRSTNLIHHLDRSVIRCLPPMLLHQDNHITTRRVNMDRCLLMDIRNLLPHTTLIRPVATTDHLRPSTHQAHGMNENRKIVDLYLQIVDQCLLKLDPCPQVLHLAR